MQPIAFEHIATCICPLCGKAHKKAMRWTGNGSPRVYCRNCSWVVSGMGDYAVEGKFFFLEE